MRPKIVVIGSANMDMIARTARIPKPGETVLGEGFVQSNGGKGANQAVAASRLGAEVAFVARLGKDASGSHLFGSFQEEGIDTRYIAWDEETPSGVALIMVDGQGENIICVAPGANARLSKEDILRAEQAIRSADCVLLQLEIPLETVEYAVSMAAGYHVKVLLNPSPMTRLPLDLLKMVYVLTPNEAEAAALIGSAELQIRELATTLNRKYGLKNVITTLGKVGAVISSLDESEPIHVLGFPVDTVDATGAGDAFNGGLAVALARGDSLVVAVRYANAVGALATTRIGAQSSMPTSQEVDIFLNDAAKSI